MKMINYPALIIEYFKANVSPLEAGAIIAMWLAVFLAFFKKDKKHAAYTLFWGLVIIYITLLRRTYAPAEMEKELQAVTEEVKFAPNYYLNVVLFAPFGFFASRTGKWLNCIISGAVLSAFCELVQLITGCGYADIFDLLSNILGSISGGAAASVYFALIGIVKNRQ